MSDLMKYDELYKTLAGNAALMTKVSGIYDSPQDDAAPPYIEMSTVQEVNDELLDNSGAEVSVDLDIWAKASGVSGARKQILEIRDRIVDAIPAWALYDGIVIMRDGGNPDWWHGVATIRYYDRRTD